MRLSCSTTDAGLGAAVEARLRKFLLRTKATITLEPGPRRRRQRHASLTVDRERRSSTNARCRRETGWVDRAVSFTKGCYTGQELVARMDSRVAEPPRRLVRLTAAGALEPGAPIVVDDAEVGVVTSAAGNDRVGLREARHTH